MSLPANIISDSLSDRPAQAISLLLTPQVTTSTLALLFRASNLILVLDEIFTPTYTKLGDGTALVASLTPGTCIATAGVVDNVGAGACTLQASVGAGTNHMAAIGTVQSFSIGKAHGSVSINNIPSSAVYGGSFIPTFTRLGDGAVLAASLTTGTCTVTSGVVDYVGAGTCTLQALIGAGTNHLAASGPLQSFTIDKADQTITFTSSPPSEAVVGGTYTPTAIGGASGNLVTFTIDASATLVCSISGGTVSFIADGVCLIHANQNGNTNYNAAPQAHQSFGIGLTYQTITTITNAIALATNTVVGQSYPVTFSVAPKSGIGTPTGNVTVSDGVNECVGTVSSGTCNLISTTAGTKSLTATYAGDVNYGGSVSSAVLHTVSKAPGSVSINNIPASAVYGGSFTPTFTKLGDGTASVASLTTGTCTVSAGEVNYVGAGTCTLQASVGAGTNHLAATGRSNDRILANARNLALSDKPLLFRTPVVPTVNDSPEDIKEIASFVKGLIDLRKACGTGMDGGANITYELLSFHRLSSDKYRSLGLGYKASSLNSPPKEQMQMLADVAGSLGIAVRVR